MSLRLFLPLLAAAVASGFVVGYLWESRWGGGGRALATDADAAQRSATAREALAAVREIPRGDDRLTLARAEFLRQYPHSWLRRPWAPQAR